MGLTSTHFSERELRCPCCGVNGVVEDLLDALEAFRLLVEAPVIVDSAYRCPLHNAAVGGATNSQHVLGRATDVRVAGKTARELYELALQVPEIKGVGVSDYDEYLHLDVREAKKIIQWCYNELGGQVPWYEV